MERLDIKTLRKVGKLHEEGRSLRSLGIELGVERHHLSQQLKEAGLAVRGRGTARLPSEVKKLSDLEWARIAAFIEGGGSITTHKSKTPNHRVWISVSQSDSALLYWLQGKLGGKVYRRPEKRGDKQRIQSQWVSTRQRSTLIILVKCLPYFISSLKRGQAVAGIKTLITKDYRLQEKYAKRIKYLKHKEIIPTTDQSP